MQSISKDDVNRLSQNIVIPPRPELLNELHQLAINKDANHQDFVKLIAKDLGLSACVIKTANSPAFLGRGQVTNISHAISVLGQKNIRQIATAFILRQSTQSQATQSIVVALEHFWEWSNRVAMISALVSQHVGACNAEDMYCFGLFRDCGIPILLMRFPSYGRTLELAHQASDSQFLKIEEEFHQCHHATIGYLVARAWLFPDEICEAILQHHEEDFFVTENPIAPSQTSCMVAIGRLAEHIEATLSHRPDPGWGGERGLAILKHLGLELTEFEDLRDAIHSRFQD